MALETEIVPTSEPTTIANITFLLHYNDGTVLQLDKDVTYGNIKRDGLEAVEVYKKDKGLVFQLFLESDYKLIYRRRVQIHSNEEQSMIVYILGWRKKADGKDIQSINFIYEDNDIIQQLPRFNESHVLFCEPEYSEAEQ